MLYNNRVIAEISLNLLQAHAISYFTVTVNTTMQ
jgi:hypothetical protein